MKDGKQCRAGDPGEEGWEEKDNWGLGEVIREGQCILDADHPHLVPSHLP